jgi:hypothetical protein
VCRLLSHGLLRITVGGPVPELTKGLGTLGRTIERRGEGWLGSAPP